MKTVLSMIAVIGSLWSVQAAAVDSLLGPRGQTFTFFHMYSKPGGETVVEEVPAVITAPNAVNHMLFAGPAKHTGMYWIPGGFATPIGTPNMNEHESQIALILQGDFIVQVSGGKEYRVKPGNIILAEDLTGFGHRTRCEAKDKVTGCMMITIAPEDRDKFFENVKMAKLTPKE